MPSLSVVLPAYNEEENVASAVEEVSNVAQQLGMDYEIILVNDGSADRTGEIARELAQRIPNFRLVEHYPNRGYGGSLKAGFAAATKDLIAFVPTDKQFVFSEITRLLEGLDEADIVSGYRADRQDHFIRKLNAFGWNTLIRLLFGHLCRDIDCGFKLFRREILERVKIVSDGAMIDTEFLAGAQARGFRIADVPVTHLPRLAGEATGANLLVVARAFCDLVRFRRRLSRELREEKRGNDTQERYSRMSHSPASSIQHPATDFEVLQQTLGHRFRDLNLLRRALTHPSYVNEHPEGEIGDNQRLEFLGDAVLDFVAGAWVYRHYSDFDEGRMTRLRAALVRARTLAQLARQVEIGRALRLGHGEEEAGGRERDANLCDVFEAVVGALYLDGGMAAAEAFVEPLIGPVAEATLAADADWDAKSRLQEWSQAELGVTPRYRTVAEKGPDHAKIFVAEVLLGKKVAGQGEGRSKQAAEQAAAQAAWESLVQQKPAVPAVSSPGNNAGGTDGYTARSRFNEWSQAEWGCTPSYRIVAEEGPPHAKTFVAEVLLGEEVVGRGEGCSKQAAKQAAAKAAWESLAQQDFEVSELSLPDSSE